MNLNQVLGKVIFDYIPKTGEEVNRAAIKRSSMALSEALMVACDRLKARGVPVPNSALDKAILLNAEIELLIAERYRAELALEKKNPDFEIQAMKNIKLAAE